jgi:hypothetical protein
MHKYSSVWVLCQLRTKTGDSSAINLVCTPGGQLDNDLYGADQLITGDDVKSLNRQSDTASMDPIPLRLRVSRLTPNSIVPKTCERKLASAI